jgi:hypothetical protein
MPITKATASSIAPAAKGDLVVGSATNDASVLAVGSANQVLTVDSSTATGLKWAAPSGDWVKITETVNSSTAAFSFTSIPTTYRHLILIMNGRSNLSAVWGTGFLRFNNDSSSIYDWECAPDGVNAAGVTGAGQSYAAPFAPVASTATANNSSSFFMIIPNYKGTTFFKTGQCISGAFYNTTAADFKTNNSSFLWRSTAAINRIDIDDAGGGGGFISGSVCTLYGVM